MRDHPIAPQCPAAGVVKGSRIYRTRRARAAGQIPVRPERPGGTKNPKTTNTKAGNLRSRRSGRRSRRGSPARSAPKTLLDIRFPPRRLEWIRLRGKVFLIRDVQV